MIQTVIFENFKALKKNQISFGKVSILAGLNSAGKSSVIQGLLLMRSLAERSKSEKNKEPFTITNFPLNGNYLLSLGSTIETISKDTGKSFKFTIIDKNSNVYVSNFSTNEALNDASYKLDASPSSGFYSSSIGRSDFYYLNAERLGPRTRHWINEKGSKLDCGFRGEYTVEVLARTIIETEEYPVTSDKILDDKKLPSFQDIPSYTAQWMEYITPGSAVGNAEIFGAIRSASINHNGSSPPNVGFGISYALPIVVTGLLAKSGSIMIVENPEAHLHPKGQSNIGFFLGQMAASGVQVIIETHSEHVINGVIRATMKFKNLNHKDVCISFFGGINEDREADVQPISISKEGDLEPFPVDFFDQVQQDMADLYGIRKSENNG